MSQSEDNSMTLSDELDSIGTETGSESVAAIVHDEEPTPRQRTSSRRSGYGNGASKTVDSGDVNYVSATASSSFILPQRILSTI